MRSEPEIAMSKVICSHMVRRQRGAALVVGLILLTVITLLAIAGMNSASLGLVMAGNTQYQERAFQAAEAGIEQAMAGGEYIVPKTTVEKHPNVALTTSEKVSTELSLDLGGAPQPAIWGNSFNSFSTYHFAIKSTGTSTRNAQAIHNQGVAKLSPFSPSITGSGELK
jgi:type IV pilus assembly protein PilX